MRTLESSEEDIPVNLIVARRHAEGHEHKRPAEAPQEQAAYHRLSSKGPSDRFRASETFPSRLFIRMQTHPGALSQCVVCHCC